MKLYISNCLKIARCLRIIFQIWKANQNVLKEKHFLYLIILQKCFVNLYWPQLPPPPIKSWVRPWHHSTSILQHLMDSTSGRAYTARKVIYKYSNWSLRVLKGSRRSPEDGPPGLEDSILAFEAPPDFGLYFSTTTRLSY